MGRNLIQRFREEGAFRRIFWNSSWLFLDRIIRMGFSLLVGVWVARYLGPTEYGLLSYSQVTVALVAAFGSLGLERLVIRDLVLEPSAKDEILATSLALRVLGGLFAWCSAVGLALVLNPGAPRIWGLVAILGGGVVAQATDIFDYWYQSRTESKYAVLAKNGAFLVTVAVRVTLILVKAPLVWFAVALTLELVLAAGALSAVYLRTGGSFRSWKPSRSRAVRLLREGWPLMLSGMSVMIYMRIDQLMLKSLCNAQSVGIYSAAVRISEMWYFIPMAIVASSAPTIVEGKKLNDEMYLDRNKKLFRVLVVLALLVSIVISLTSTWTVQKLYGSAYAGAGPVLALHAWAGIFVALGVAQGPWIVAENMPIISLRRTIGGALVNVALNLIFLARYGVLAAACASLIAQFFSCFVVNACFKSSRPLFWLQLRSLLFWRT